MSLESLKMRASIEVCQSQPIYFDVIKEAEDIVRMAQSKYSPDDYESHLESSMTGLVDYYFYNTRLTKKAIQERIKKIGSVVVEVPLHDDGTYRISNEGILDTRDLLDVAPTMIQIRNEVVRGFNNESLDYGRYLKWCEKFGFMSPELAKFLLNAAKRK